ncbi:MAG: cob(I)yrinic acid a,c-diamide adenosyltransferase [Desulfuromonadales bacterium]|nr:cob(I)yrinic acid a,c-diamide adenosyltransferase [Desulfuromonadales bacterium]
MSLENGYVQVYTGNGKGKTTAALGLAFRAIGRGLKVCLIQFMKGGGPYGEHFAAEKMTQNMTVRCFGRDGWVKKGSPNPEDLAEADRAYRMAEASLESEDYDLVILDEMNGAVDFGLLSVEQALRLLDLKGEKVELVLTGRNACPEIIQRADLVTEMCEIKHYYQAGVDARVGIER